MTTHEFKVILIGGPESGKTSYLGALWSSVRDAELSAPVHLRGSLPAKTQYLDAAEHALLACERVERTRGGTAERVALELSVDGHNLNLEYLDLAGESVEAALELRMVGHEFADHLEDTNCLFLFIHPNPALQQTISEANNRLRAIDPGLAPVADAEATDAAEAKADSAAVDPLAMWKSAPTSVHLVDLLQVAEGLRRYAPCHIAVIISAWDIVAGSPDASLTPRRWLERQMPLLHQYLSTNELVSPWTVFGISAQGGDFGNSNDVERLLDLNYPERTIVESDAGRGSDIAEPLRWFIQGSM